MTLTTSWQKAAEASYTINQWSTANTLLYLRYDNRDTGNNRDTIYWEIRAAATGSSYGYGYDESYSIYDGSTLRASGNHREGIWPGDPVSSERVVASGSWVQSHNADGSWSTTLTYNGHVYGSAYTRNIAVSLPTIARYATVSTSTSNVTDTTVNVSWSSDVAVDQVQYKLNSGSWVDVETGVNKTGGSYTISGLSPGTTYTIAFDYKRRDSQQWSYGAGYSGSSTITTRRYPVPSTTISNITQTSVQINWSTDVNVDTAQYRLNSGSWVDAQTGLNASSGSYTISGLSPGTTYTFDFDYKRYNTSDWSSYAGRTNTTVKTTLDYMVRIKVNSSWKEAIPYININGTWKKAVPYIKINGSWKLGI